MLSYICISDVKIPRCLLHVDCVVLYDIIHLMPERFRSELLTVGHYTNPASFYTHPQFPILETQL